MIGNQKEKKEHLKNLILTTGGVKKRSRFSEIRQVFNVENLFQLIGISLQITLGLGVVTLAIVGLIQPLWVSTVFSIFGSASVMFGLYSAYQFFTNHHIFDSLINKAIRRVIQSQN